MSVFRVEKTKGYTVMSNHHLRNHALSLKAKGLLSQMLSLPDDWDYTLQGLAQINKESIDAIREAVRELERAGYIKRSRERDEHGCLRGTVYTIYEQPHAEPTPEEPTQEKPALDNPTLEKPMLDIRISRRRCDPRGDYGVPARRVPAAFQDGAGHPWPVLRCVRPSQDGFAGDRCAKPDGRVRRRESQGSGVEAFTGPVPG